MAATSQIYSHVVAAMSSNPPDPHDRGPLYNHKETMYGVVIPFQILSWAAVSFRLYTRFRIQHEPGLDDLFVVLAALFNLAAMIAFLIGVEYGLGKHIMYISYADFQKVYTWLYVQDGAYTTTSLFIKVSLLCQYLRLFQKGPLRTICRILMVLVCAWGVAYSFVAWFPCIPIRGFWDGSIHAKCYGFGSPTLSGIMAAFTSFAATNMALDICIFLIPLTKYFKPGLCPRQYMALSALFTLGAVVIVLAVLRFWTAAKHDPNAITSLDILWWYPLTLIFACLEVDFALMCASMPIFWPVLVQSFTQIVVVQEVHVTHQHRFNEIDSLSGYEMGRAHSVKSQTSMQRLNETPKDCLAVGREDDRFARDYHTGKAFGVSEVEIQGQKR